MIKFPVLVFEFFISEKINSVLERLSEENKVWLRMSLEV